MICAGNWKLNKSPKETKSFLNELKASLQGFDPKEFIVFPPTISLSSASEALGGDEIGFGAQNISSQESGAFTGETSVDHVKELGASYALVGHSERRSLYGETDEDVHQKTKLCLEKKMTPVVCVGETLEQREAGQTNMVIEKQLMLALEGVDFEAKVILAYEPVWAIGTGQVASVEQVGEVHSFIRTFLSEKIGDTFAKTTPLLYGGSVKPDSAAELSKVKNVDGFLIGGASLKVDSFIDIYKNSVPY